MHVIKKITLYSVLLFSGLNLCSAEVQLPKESFISHKNMVRLERVSSLLALGTIVAFVTIESTSAIMASCVFQMINIGVNTALRVGYEKEKRALKRMIPPIMFLGASTLGITKTIKYSSAVCLMALAAFGMVVKELSDLTYKERKYCS